MTGSVLLEASGLEVSYGAVQVLFDVDLVVHQGETLALLGTNGAGKSTLLKAISGLVPAHAGTTIFDGADITNRATDARVSAGIVQARGGNAVFPTMSVRDNLRLGGFTLVRNKAVLAERTNYVLGLFPTLGDRLDQRAGTLSGGEQQMLALAKALLLRPRLLVIDELSLGLAPIIVEQLLVLISGLKGEGLTMLIVEQSLNVACAFADRAVFMEKGEVRFSGDPADLLDNGDLVRAVFLGGGAGRR